MKLPTVRRLVSVLAVAVGLLFPLTAAGEVVRFEILERVPLAGGKSYGTTGSYERITGRVYYAVDPTFPQNVPVIESSLRRETPQEGSSSPPITASSRG